MRKKVNKEESSDVVPFLPEDELKQLQKDVEGLSKPENIKRVSASAIVGLLGEFFESFIVFAYDMDGNHFVLRKTDNSRDHKAIAMLVTDYVDEKINMSPNFSKKSMNDIEKWLEKELLEEDDEEFEEDDEDDME